MSLHTKPATMPATNSFLMGGQVFSVSTHRESEGQRGRRAKSPGRTLLPQPTRRIGPACAVFADEQMQSLHARAASDGRGPGATCSSRPRSPRALACCCRPPRDTTWPVNCTGHRVVRLAVRTSREGNRGRAPRSCPVLIRQRQWRTATHRSAAPLRAIQTEAEQCI